MTRQKVKVNLTLSPKFYYKGKQKDEVALVSYLFETGMTSVRLLWRPSQGKVSTSLCNTGTGVLCQVLEISQLEPRRDAPKTKGTREESKGEKNNAILHSRHFISLKIVGNPMHCAPL